MDKQQELPEFIQGLATNKSASKQRREVVENKWYLNFTVRLILGVKNDGSTFSILLIK